MRIVCGLDVHKDSVFACILNENGEKFECKFGVLTLNWKNCTSYSLHRM